MHFLFVLIELFLLGVMAKAIPVSIDWKLAFLKGGGSVLAKFPRRRERCPTNIFVQIDRPMNALRLCF